MSDLANLFDEIVRYETELWTAIDTEMRKSHGLPLGRFEPMAVIVRTPGCRVHDISRALSISTGGASKLVDTIEQAGFCHRQPNPADRRSSLLALTHEGMRVYTRASRIFERALAERLGNVLPAQDQQHLAVSIAKLRQALAAPHAGRDCVDAGPAR